MAEMETIYRGEYGIAISCVNASDGSELSGIISSNINTIPILERKETQAGIIGTDFLSNENECFMNTGVLPVWGYQRKGDMNEWKFALSLDEKSSGKTTPFSIVYNKNGAVVSNEKPALDISGFFGKYDPNKRITNLAIKFPIFKNGKTDYAYGILTLYNGKYNEKVKNSADTFKAEFLKSKGFATERDLI